MSHDVYQCQKEYGDGARSVCNLLLIVPKEKEQFVVFLNVLHYKLEV